MRTRRWLVLILLWAALTSCAPRRGVDAVSWAGTDLRALDAADPVPPESDLTALYIRRQAEDVQIRLDLLDFTADLQSNLLITIWDNAAFASDPLQILIPAQKAAHVLERATCTAWIIPRVQRDPLRDTVTLTLRADYLGSRLRVEALTLSPQESQPLDALSGTLDAPPPDGHANLYLAFYHVLPADTPLQTLRSWDGAHTGPHGTRHGLKYLLNAAQSAQTPLILLDARTPRTLAALDLLGQTDRLRQGQIAGWLTLPQAVYTQPAPAGQDTAFGLRASPFAYTPYLADSSRRWQFMPLADTRHLYHAAGTVYLPLPNEDAAFQPQESGPPLALRRAILQAALNDDPDDLLALGGDLSASDWGTAHAVDAALQWLSARPYIHILNGTELQTFPSRPNPPFQQTGYIPPPVPQAETAPPVASDLRFTLGASLNAALTELEAQNLALHAAIWQQAADWAARPRPLETTCTPLCVLSDGRYLAFIEPQHGWLLYLFVHAKDGLHQIIAPSSQAAIGLADASTWDLNAGWQADPSTRLALDDGERYHLVTRRENFVQLASGQGTRTFWLDAEGFHIQTQGAEMLPIPVLLDPWTRFQPGWQMQRRAQRLSDGWLLTDGETAVRFRSAAALERISWQDSLPTLTHPEAPDADYPAGYFLPFPLDLLIWHPADAAQLDIRLETPAK